MRTAATILLAIFMLFWGCTHFDVVLDNAKEGTDIWLALAFGLAWVLISGTCIVYATLHYICKAF